MYQGWKTYEVTNHLGNVLSLLSDRKEPNSMISGVATSYNPVVIAAKDYYPFGIEMEGRANALENYRYGFNGKEADQDEWGSLTHYDYGFRIYNPGIGRFLSVDPLAEKYPSISNYAYVANNPIIFIDPDGRSIELPNARGRETFPQMQSDVFGSQIFNVSEKDNVSINRKA